MLLLISCCFLSFILVFFLNIFSLFISESVTLNREELTPYECGFEHHSLSRVPFSLRYFFLTLIFLLFDLEVVLILFIPSSLFSSSLFTSLLVLLFFVVVLFLSLIYEWNDGTLDWLS